MGIFGAGSGGLLVVATGIVELAFPVLRIIDDSVDLLRNSHFCLIPPFSCPFSWNSAFFGSLLFLSAFGYLVPGCGPNYCFFVLEAARAYLVYGPRFYGHGWPAEPRY